MGTPTYPVLDNFNRADEDPLSGGGNWSTGMYTGESAMRLSSNAAIGASGAWGGRRWNAATFGGDCESGGTITNLSSGGVVVFCRAANIGTALDSYSYWYDLSNTKSVLIRIDNDVDTSLDEDTTDFVANDKFCIQAIGSAIKGFHYTGGAWNERCSAVDTTYSAAGYAGLEAYSACAIDDFGAQTIGAATATTPGTRLALMGVGL